MLGSGLLTLIFGCHECSDFWGDCMKTWWTSVRSKCRGIRRLVIYLDNGPKNSGVTRKFLRRIVEFLDWSGLAPVFCDTALGLLPTLSQQVQSHRTLLVVAATQVERRATDLLGSGASMWLENDMVWRASQSTSPCSQLRRRSRCDQC